MEKKMATKIDRDKIIEAMYKKAIGYDIDEDSEEIVLDGESEIKNHKKKLSKKHYAPDVTAARACLELFSEEMMNKYERMNEVELLAERNRLLKELETADHKTKLEETNNQTDIDDEQFEKEGVEDNADEIDNE